MSAYWMLENAWAFSVQFAAVAGLTLLLARMGRRAAPAMRLALLQLGLLLALATPFLHVESGPMLEAPAFGVVTVDAPNVAPPPARGIRPTTLLVLVLLAGAALRLAWILLGLAALSHRRRRARLVTADCWEFLDMRSRVDVEAELLVGDSGPVAFGFFRPAVLIPAGLLTADNAALRAVLAHEMVHLRRRDWLFVLAEELLTAVLWFHPFAWLLVREIRLTREETVDEQAAGLVSSADAYLDALLQVARARLAPAQGLGAEFLRERQIARRIATLSRQENNAMPRPLQYSLTSFSALAIGAIAWWTTSLSPLQGAPQAGPLLADGSGAVAVSQGADGLILPRQTPLSAMYSLGAQLRGVEGEVTLELTLDVAGRVVDARAVSGPMELRQGAVKWAFDWRYDPSVQASRTVLATVSFKRPGASMEIVQPLTALSSLAEHADIPEESLVFRKISVPDPKYASPELVDKLMTYIGQSFAADPNLAWTLYGEIINAATPETFTGPSWVILNEHGATLLLGPGVVGPQALNPGQQPPPPPDRIKVDREVQSSRAVDKIQPSYPPLARKARIQGTVHLAIIVGKNGAVQQIDVLTGHPLLIPASVEAVKQWVYRPTLLNGQPVEVETTVNVNFTLAD